MRRHCKRQPHIHPRRITLYRRIQELLDLRKIHNLIKLLLDLRPTHPENSSIKKNILPPSQLRMKTGADLQQTGHPPHYPDTAGGRLGDAAENFEECRFPSAITTDDADTVALFNLE